VYFHRKLRTSNNIEEEEEEKRNNTSGLFYVWAVCYMVKIRTSSVTKKKLEKS
jgi:hypothetical protein